MERVSLLLVDDHKLFRESLVSLLERHRQLKVVGEAVDGLDALEKARKLKPDVILMDISMPRCSGLNAVRLIKSEMPEAKIIILTVSEKNEDLFEAIKAGAKGYLLKNVYYQEFVRSIVAVSAGDAIVSPRMATKLLDGFATLADREATPPKADASPVLTDRESEILRLVAKGTQNKEIAKLLFISEATVKTHIRNILEKLHLHNKLQAVAYAVRSGLDKTGGGSGQ